MGVVRLEPRWQTSFGLLVGILVLTVVLVWSSLRWPASLTLPDGGSPAGLPVGGADSLLKAHPLVETFKLVVAAFIGILVTAVQRRLKPDRAVNRSMEQAQVLLCVSGAMMMIIIGNSLARAFGIAGAAGLIRFRTPVDDPRDVTILFLLMGLGMSAGLGAFGVAGLGTVFLCACLLALGRVREPGPRSMKVALVAESRTFPTAHVQQVFARHQVAVEPIDLSQGDTTTVRYRATLGAGASIEDISAQLVNGGGDGIKSVSWESPKKGR